MEEPDEDSEGSSLPPNTLMERVRQPRTVYSVEQKKLLESFFENNQYPSYDERETLAARLNLQEQQVQVWFKNRRAKHRKQHEGTQQPSQATAPSIQDPRAGAPAPTPAASASGFSRDAWSPGFSGDAEAPGEASFAGDAGFYSPPPPNTSGGIVAAEISSSNHMQACWGPTQDAQHPVPAAAAAAAAALAPASTPVWPEEPYTSGFYSDLLEGPTLADLLSSQDPLEGRSSLQAGCPKDEESEGEDDSSPKKFLDL